MKDYKRLVSSWISGLEIVKAAGLNEADVYALIEKPKDAAHGEYAFPCFRLAKALGKAPQAIAAEAAAELKEPSPLCPRAYGPYLNFFIDRAIYCEDIITDVLSKGARFGGSDIGKGKRMLVEFSSPNIAKPFHIGHIRSTVQGNALANILAFLGYEVSRLNHLGDYGTQFGKLIVAYRRFGSKAEVEAAPIPTLLKYYVEFHEKAADDPSLDEEARAAFAALERGEKDEKALWEWFREESLKEFTAVYDVMGIKFDSYDGESFFSDKMDRFTEELEKDGLLLESDGAYIVDLEEYGLGKALIKKSDGSTLYITRDIAAAVYRKEHYDFYKNIYVVAAQQDLHFKQWIKILELMGYEWAGDCVHVPFGLVRLADGAMKTRTGNVVFLEDVLSQAVEKTRAIVEEKGIVTDDIDKTARQIGIGAVVFQELFGNRIKDYVFDWEKVLNFEGETGPYAQYSFARAASVLRKAEEMEIDTRPEALLGSLMARGAEAAPQAAVAPSPVFAVAASEPVFSLAKLIGELPDVVAEAAEKYEPSLLTRHITDISQAFSVFYHEEPILGDTGDARLVKLALTAAAKQAIGNGLALLGISAPERM